MDSRFGHLRYSASTLVRLQYFDAFARVLSVDFPTSSQLGGERTPEDTVSVTFVIFTADLLACIVHHPGVLSPSDQKIIPYITELSTSCALKAAPTCHGITLSTGSAKPFSLAKVPRPRYTASISLSWGA